MPARKKVAKFNAHESEIIGNAVGLRGDAVKVRSKRSGFEGVVFVDDPHVYVEGFGVAGWYRRSDVERDFLKV